MKKLSALKAIRKFCLACCGESSKEVELCTANPEAIKAARASGDDTAYEGCPLYIYRSGHNPARKGIGGPKKSQFKAKTWTQHRPEGTTKTNSDD